MLFCKGVPGELTVGVGRSGRRGRSGGGGGASGVMGTMHMLDATIRVVFKIGHESTEVI